MFSSDSSPPQPHPNHRFRVSLMWGRSIPDDESGWPVLRTLWAIAGGVFVAMVAFMLFSPVVLSSGLALMFWCVYIALGLAMVWLTHLSFEERRYLHHFKNGTLNKRSSSATDNA